MNLPALEIGLLVLLILVNAVFAGSEIALISLREGQLASLETRSRSGKVLTRLARDPNRFLSTIQIGITLAGFLASAFAAVSLAEPLVPSLGFLGGAAEPVAVVLVTGVLTFITLVVGELAPKRVAMQRAEKWGLLVARPLDLLARIARPIVWMLGHTTDWVVRLLGADPSLHRDQITEEELRDMVVAQTAFTNEQRTIISGAFEIGERTLQKVLVPRTRVFSLPRDLTASAALRLLVESGYSRAPVVGEDLDDISGVTTIRSLFETEGPLTDHVQPALELPESVTVVDALRVMQTERQQLAVVVNEHGGIEGIVTLEDLIEELVGEIYDETDRDILSVVHEDDGSIIVPGSFPVHDLVDLKVDVPTGEYTTVAGLMLNQLGYIPRRTGASITVAGRDLEVVKVEGRAISQIRIHPQTAPDEGEERG